MKTNKNIRTLRSYNKGIFKALNQAYGFNWEKPVDVVEVKIPFTLKKAVDLLPHDYTNGRGKVVILIHYPETASSWVKNKTYMVGVFGTSAGDFNISYDGYMDFPYRYAVDTYYRKGDFNDARKDTYNGAKAFIIAQSNENRANIGKSSYECMIKNYTDRDKKNAGTDQIYKTWDNLKGEYVEHRRTRIDKSGYRVELKQEELKERARKIKQERDKAAFLASDNAAKIAELKNRVEIAKAVIIERMKAANTENAFYDIRNHGMYELINMYRYLERVIEGDREKTLASLKLFNGYCDDVERCANRIIAWTF